MINRLAVYFSVVFFHIPNRCMRQDTFARALSTWPSARDDWVSYYLVYKFYRLNFYNRRIL